jgi:hypothetical protein
MFRATTGAAVYDNNTISKTKRKCRKATYFFRNLASLGKSLLLLVFRLTLLLQNGNAGLLPYSSLNSTGNDDLDIVLNWRNRLVGALSRG